MSDLFVFICAKTTADFVVPVTAASQIEFNRKVANAFSGMVGGVLTVGDLKFRPSQDALRNHLLCDGSTIARDNFPELVEYLNPGGATATLPNYAGASSITAPTVTQTTTTSGTVSNSGTTPSDAGDTGGTVDGNVLSGARVKYLNDISAGQASSR